jgi:hypothetical protein
MYFQLFLKKPSTLPPFLYIYLTSKLLIVFLNLHTWERKKISPYSILCTLMSSIIPLLTLMLIHTWWKSPTLGGSTIFNNLSNIANETCSKDNSWIWEITYIIWPMMFLTSPPPPPPPFSTPPSSRISI